MKSAASPACPTCSRSSARNWAAPSDWITVDQKRIDLFADAADDHQWIHVDPALAAKDPPRHGRARLPPR
ncbi:MAG: MaoC/PaaZ C-terminal domain-containing protein [Rubrivivax sp.]